MTFVAPRQDRPRLRAQVVAASARPAPPRHVACGRETVDRLLEAARRSAELAGLDPVLSVVDDQVHAQCLDRLAAPPRPNEALRRLLKTAAPTGSGVSARVPERLAAHHDARAFECGVPSLDDWLRHSAYQSQSIGASRTFVACEIDRVVGYYTLSAGGLTVARKPLPAFNPPPIPVAILGRVAVDGRRHRQGLGRALVRDAVLRLLQAGHAFPADGVLVEAVSPESRSCFVALGFEPSCVDGITSLASVADLRLAAH